VLGSLVVVTGPTVIQPILRAVRLAPRLRSVLASEAILIDPIGVIGAVATLEIVLALERGAADGSWQSILLELTGPFIGGTLVGIAVAAAGVLLLRALGARANLNVAGFALCMIAVGAGESLAHEGGLVAATVAGTILSNLQAVKTSDLREFKEQIASILVGMLFVLLASSFDLDALRALTAQDLLLVAVILLVVRPLSVGLATLGSALDWRERLFACLFAPRGVVATAVATLTTRELARMIKQEGIDFQTLPDGAMDSPLGQSTGAADIFANTGGFSGNFSSVVWSGLVEGQSASFDASTGFVSITAVPEPSTYAMALAGLAYGGFSMWRRRRKRA
jgi:NhaP-type Na+/H+ or K+/H+ antiporter